MEHARHLGARRAYRERPLEDVVALVGIELAELVAEDRLVVGDEVEPSEPVVDDVELAAPVAVPLERSSLARYSKLT
ncbi:MAG: hypothetical protein FJW14_02205 [Acidimicrobiia bacterium]|nr:hypothetical protein [Acidimicrobiia bacterium]